MNLELDDDGSEAAAYCPISAVCFQNLSSLDLKMLTESAAIISCGRLFQWPTTRWLKKFLLISSYFSSASDFVNSSIVPSQLIGVFCPLKELLRVNIFFVGQQFMFLLSHLSVFCF